MITGSEPWETATTYRFDQRRSRTMIDVTGSRHLVGDEFEGTARNWADHLKLRSGISTDSEHYVVFNMPELVCQTLQIHFTPEPSEVEIAREIGHLALGQNVDTCFATAVFEGRGNQDSPAEVEFISRIAISQQVSDLFVEDLISQFSTEFAVDLIEANYEYLDEIAKSPGVWTDPDSLKIDALYQDVAICASAAERMGARDWQNGDRVLRIIENAIHEKAGNDGIDKVSALRDLYSTIPELPKDREKAVRKLEGITREVARILDYTVPVLEYSSEHNWHYWTRVQQLKLTEAEKRGVL